MYIGVAIWREENACRAAVNFQIRRFICVENNVIQNIIFNIGVMCRVTPVATCIGINAA